MTTRSILYDVQERTASITLNRPDKRNALDDVMVADLTTAVAAAGRDPGVRVVVLAGAGDSFCAGVDLGYLSRISTYDLESNRDDSRRLAHLFRLLYELRKPVIALIAGAFQEAYEKGVSFGHITAMISGRGDSATEKREILKNAGARVAASLEEIPELIAQSSR